MIVIETTDPSPAITHTKTPFSGTLDAAKVAADEIHAKTGRSVFVTIDHSVYYKA